MLTIPPYFWSKPPKFGTRYQQILLVLWFLCKNLEDLEFIIFSWKVHNPCNISRNWHTYILITIADKLSFWILFYSINIQNRSFIKMGSRKLPAINKIWPPNFITLFWVWHFPLLSKPHWLHPIISSLLSKWVAHQ